MIPLKITIAQTDFRDFEEMARRYDLDVVYNFPRFFIILLLIAALGSFVDRPLDIIEYFAALSRTVPHQQ